MKFVENINKNQKKVKAKVVTDSLGPRGLYIVHGILQPEYLFPSPGDLPSSGIKARSPTLQTDFLPAEPQGKPKNIGVGSLSFL